MKPLLLALLLVPTLCSADNLFKNANMDSTGGWTGDKKFVTEDKNRYLALEANKNKTVSFSQVVTTRDAKDLIIKLRYRTKDYAGRGFIVRGTRGDGGSTYNSHNLVADGQWHDITWDFSSVRGSNKLDISFELMDGTGTVFFDDASADVKDAASPTASPGLK